MGNLLTNSNPKYRKWLILLKIAGLLQLLMGVFSVVGVYWIFKMRYDLFLSIPGNTLKNISVYKVFIHFLMPAFSGLLEAIAGLLLLIGFRLGWVLSTAIVIESILRIQLMWVLLPNKMNSWTLVIIFVFYIVFALLLLTPYSRERYARTKLVWVSTILLSVVLILQFLIFHFWVV
jgi:hypothetical protein